MEDETEELELLRKKFEEELHAAYLRGMSVGANVICQTVYNHVNDIKMSRKEKLAIIKHYCEVALSNKNNG